MTSATINIKRSKRGRPRTDSTPLMVRLQPDQLAALDAWIFDQDDRQITRPEAIRTILATALAGQLLK